MIIIIETNNMLYKDEHSSQRSNVAELNCLNHSL